MRQPEKEMVGATGFEPATSSSQSWRSSQAELRSDPRQALIRSQKRTKAKVFFQIVRGSGASSKQGLGVAPYWARMVSTDDAFVFHLGRAFAAGFGGGDLGTLACAHRAHLHCDIPLWDLQALAMLILGRLILSLMDTVVTPCQL